MRRAVPVFVALAAFSVGCRHSARPHLYEVQVRQTLPPIETSHAVGWVSEHDCALWETTYAWREIKRDRKPTRPERLRVKTKCVSGPARVPSSTKTSKKTSPPAPVAVTVEDKSQNRLLETFTITEGAATVVHYRDDGGERVTVEGASKVQFYENVVIIRKRDGSGRVVPARDFLGIDW